MDHFESIANKLIIELKVLGIQAYIWHKATTGSIYVRFNDNRMCSIRLSDHNGRNKLKYKFNLRSDISSNHKKWVKDGKVWRCYLPLNKWRELLPILMDRHNQIQEWNQSKYCYHIPSFKQEKNKSK